MKKILIVVSLIVAFGFAMANTNILVKNTKKSEVTVVADDNNGISINKEDEKKDKKEKKTCCSSTTADQKATGCSEAQKKSCAAEGKTCSQTEAEPVTKDCCSKKSCTTEKSCCSEKKK